MKVAEVRADMPFLENVVYMDAASTTPTPKPVVDAMFEYYHSYNTNIGRGAYRAAIKATSEVSKTRSRLAKFINCDHDEIIFTNNTTQAINLVSHGFNFKKGDSIIVPNIEHHSNLVPWLNLKKLGVNIKMIKADKNQMVNPADIEDAIDESTKLITLTHVSNSIGSVLPVHEIGKIAKENDIYYMVDAAQSAGHMSMDIKRIQADFMAFPGHKGFLGPVGTGLLYCDMEIMEDLEPIHLGGGTVTDVTETDFKLAKPPERFEGGTLNISGIIGLGSAIEYLNRIGMENIEKHSKKYTQMMYKGIQDVENSIVYGRPEAIYDIVGFNISGVHCHDVAKILDEQARICVRSGMHCAIPAIRQIGAYDFGGTVRASIHYYNTKEEIKILIDTLEEISRVLGD